MSNAGNSGMRETYRRVDWQQLLAPGVLVVMFAFFSVFGRNFFSTSTLKDILEASYYIGFLAIGETFVIISAGIDLSVGTNMMAAALIGGVAFNVWHWSIGVLFSEKWHLCAA